MQYRECFASSLRKAECFKLSDLSFIRLQCVCVSAILFSTLSKINFELGRKIVVKKIN